VNGPNLDDLGSLSMLELFRVEAENQTAILIRGLLALEEDPRALQTWDVLMRAAHSLKGAARIVNLQSAVRIAHALEDCFVAAQQGRLQIHQHTTDHLLRAVDVLAHLARPTDATTDADSENEHRQEIQQVLHSLTNLLSTGGAPAPPPSPPSAITESVPPGTPAGTGASPPAVLSTGSPMSPPEAVSFAISTHRHEVPERVVRLTAENLNRLLGLAGESLVGSRWLRPFADSLQRLKRRQAGLSQKLDELRSHFSDENLSERAEDHLNELCRQVSDCQQFLTDRMQELDIFDRQSAQLSQRLYLEALRTRMRPFGDGTRRFPRMVRDLARSLGKEIRLEILGQNTQVDRDILERLETPLAHLLRNAVDHGCETPEQRQRVGKPAEATIRLEARHSAGMLLVSVTDDGAGIEWQRVREAIIQRKLAMPAIAERLNEPQLLDFLFLPGFTLKETVTEISGRGVGLDVVQNMVRNVRGSVRVNTQPGRGVRVQLQLPLTLSVLRTLLVEIADEPYAIPLTQITRALKLSRDKIESLEGRHHFEFRGQQIGLLTAHQVMECRPRKSAGGDLPVLVLGERNARYGLVVDRFVGQRELVVQPLDARLGKVRDISAAALMEDGSPILIVDVDEVIRSIETLVSGGLLAKVDPGALESSARRPKRVLAVDDSITVRELERKLISSRGYLADVAVDGLDAWNALSTRPYDLVITDVDMPRVDGIELTTLIKQDPHLKTLPVMIVSYKDSESDRLRGLEAGADYYLTKGSFQDETLLQAVVDLIGEPDA
jgi:two-component system, chemotaxis family, sensor histidine kinase and response regulator WspE